MRRMWAWAAALVFAVALAGCAGPAKSGMPCESCKFGVADKKASPPKWYCVVDGKEVDCRANPQACAMCKK